MYPEHCSHVSIRRVDFPLTQQAIMENSVGKEAYKRTRFIALNNGDDWAIVSVQKEGGDALFQKVRGVEILSLPERTGYVEDDGVDVLNPSHMAAARQRSGKRAVVVVGRFGHASIFVDEQVPVVRVFDAVPPRPAKLVEIARRVVDSGLLKAPVALREDLLDLGELAVGEPKVVFPCRASGLSTEGRTEYLDELPELDGEDWLLVGCDLSRGIFVERYGYEPRFTNICPLARMGANERLRLGAGADSTEDRHDVVTLAKCCKVKEGVRREGKLALVPWGATFEDVLSALSSIIGKTR